MSGYTRDGFHRGAFWLTQPEKGHRAGMDAMMLAAAIPSGFSGLAADFGAGVGAAGLAVVARRRAARVTLVELAPEMVEAARLTLSDPDNEDIAARAEILEADVSLTGKARVAAGLADNAFDYVIMNPPFNLPSDRESPDALRASAHVMHDGLLEAWLRSAAAVLKPRGGLAIIARPQSLGEILHAFDGRFGGAQIMPVHPRDDEAAIRIIIRATHSSRAALKLMPPLFLHDPGSNRFSARADLLINGQASLFGD